MKIALLGYGKMGKEIEKIAVSRGHEIILKMDAENAAGISDADLAAADVAIEFSIPASAVKNILRCFEVSLPVVVGTTGWLDKADQIRSICEQKGSSMFYSSNYSIGVNLFYQINAYLAKLMSKQEEYDVRIEETHHIHKLDSPSGTSISLATQLIGDLGRKESWINERSKDKSELSIISKREGEVPGTHTVIYDSDVDQISIRHKAHGRRGFAFGAVIAAEWLEGKKGVFGMSDLLQQPNP